MDIFLLTVFVLIVITVAFVLKSPEFKGRLGEGLLVKDLPQD